MLPRLLKPFPELPLKVLAIGTIADTKISLRFPAPNPQPASPGAAVPLVRPAERSRAPFALTHGWRHGGINE